MKKFLDYRGVQTQGGPKDVIRQAASAGFINHPALWIEMIDERNETSHSYNEEVAERVYLIAIKRPNECAALFKTLGIVA